MLSDMKQDFIISGGKIVTRNDPNFLSIVKLEYDRANKKPKPIPELTVETVIASKGQNGGICEMQNGFHVPKCTIKARIDNGNGSINFRVTKCNTKPGPEPTVVTAIASKGQKGGPRSAIPDKNTRRKWITKYFGQFQDWKRNGGTEESKPNFKVSTWTEESVFKFFELTSKELDKRKRNQESTSSTEESVSTCNLRFQACKKAKLEFQALFERRGPSRRHQLLESEDEDAPSSEDSEENETRTSERRKDRLVSNSKRVLGDKDRWELPL